MKQGGAPAARDGVGASCVVLPQQQAWPDVLAFLQARFAHVADSWPQRLAAGELWDDAGRPLAPGAPYRPGMRVWYFRSVAEEVAVPFEITVLHRDARLVVVDKPHFLACVPGGRHLQQTVLTRLRRVPGLEQATPLHRLDRETAGVMLFCIDPAARAAYQRLFEARQVEKSYEAIAPFRAALALPRSHCSRLQELPGGFVMHEVAGQPNAVTGLALLARLGGWARYRLLPHSGKKHQLRAHMAALGIAIANDPWYPAFRHDKAADDFSCPLALLARSIRFIDPFSGQPHTYHSQRQLPWPQQEPR